MDAVGSGLTGMSVLPLVRRDLGFIAFLTVMATALPFGLIFTGRLVSTCSRSSDSFGYRPTASCSMLAVSAIISLPVIAIFFVAKRQLRHTADTGQTGPSLAVAEHEANLVCEFACRT